MQPTTTTIGMKDVEYQVVSPDGSPAVPRRPSGFISSRLPFGITTRLALLFGGLLALSLLVLAAISIEESPVSKLTGWTHGLEYRPATDDEMDAGDDDEEQEPDQEESDLLEQVENNVDEDVESESEGEKDVDNSNTDKDAASPAEEDAEKTTVKAEDLPDDLASLVNLYSPDRKIIGPAEACHPDNVAKVQKGTFEYEVLSADCGLGYNYVNSSARKTPWKVALYGSNFEKNTILGLSGCLVGTGKCPYSPRCQVVATTRMMEARGADIVVIFQNDVNLINALPKREKQYRVLYWREAFYAAPSMGTQKKFDFEMGVHWFSGLLNPQFFRTPAALLGGITYPQKQVIPFLPVEQRPNFAMSVISNCNAASQRQTYIDRLVKYLGPKRIHQYGRCGNMQLPPPPIKNAAKIIAGYKFYLSFENTIEDGYVTEKLLHVLAMPVVPIYYGSPSVPNITTVPSFINVADFSHPKKLADYLLYLDSHKEEYYKYHLWRTHPKYFHPDYLKTMQMKSPGPYEMLPLRNRGGTFYPRSTACCRLCDENYVRWAAESNTGRLVMHRLNKETIKNKFFEGDYFGDPKQT